MPTTTRQLAELASVSEQTIRNYTFTYRELLSPGGRGESGQRLFSDEDVQILCAVADLRRENVPPAEIIARLSSGDLFISVPPTTEPQQATPNHTTPHNALDAPQALMLVRSDLQHQIDALVRRVSVEEVARQRRDAEAAWWHRLEGAIATLAVVAFVLWLLWLLANGAPW